MDKLIDLNGLTTFHTHILTNLIPKGAENSLVLTVDANNNRVWRNISDILPNPEYLLAYGVEWDINVGDPHITRIGNMSLHKTLPIQSQLKGCVALGGKVMYWLDENDWRYRKDDLVVNCTFSLLVEVEQEGTFTCSLFSTKRFEGAWFKCGTTRGHILSIDTDTSTATFIPYYAPMTAGDHDVTFGSCLNGYDGTVRVYCPEFWIKSEIDGDKRRVWITTIKIDDTWTHLPALLIDAYKSTVLNTVPENMGYLSTLPVNSAISVVNTNTYCRGGNNRIDYDKYLTGENNTAVNIFRTDLGKSRTNISRANMRTYARNAGSEVLSYDLYKNVFYWLYIIEYANFNCKEDYSAELTDNGYHQGGIGSGVTNISNWYDFNTNYPVTPCGYGNDIGNRTDIKLISDSGLTSTNSIYICRWRGLENPFGDCGITLDGIIIDVDDDNHPGNMNYVYTCLDSTKYADTLNDSYEKVGEEYNRVGYTKLFDLGDSAHIIPKVNCDCETQYKCSRHIASGSSKSLRILLVGGVDLGSFQSSIYTSGIWNICGFRTVSPFIS